MAFNKITVDDIKSTYVNQEKLDRLLYFDDPRVLRIAVIIAQVISTGPLLDSEFRPLDSRDLKSFINMFNRTYEFFDGQYYYIIPLSTVSGQTNIVYRRLPEFEKEFEDTSVKLGGIIKTSFLNLYHGIKNNIVEKPFTGYDTKVEWNEGGQAYLERTFLIDVMHDVLSQFATEA